MNPLTVNVQQIAECLFEKRGGLLQIHLKDTGQQ